MTKRRAKGMTDGEFEQFVDEGFRPPRKKRRDQASPIQPEVYEQLAVEGADPRLTKRQAVFNATVARCLGVPCHTLTDESVKFIREFDEGMSQAALLDGIELRND